MQSRDQYSDYVAMLESNTADPDRYTERYRSQYHFSPIKGWMNDPNGLVFFHGEWHIFYQHRCHALGPGLYWGHAVTKDLIHWRHLPPAIAPDEHGEIWSGSAVVDWKDTSGFFGGQPGIVCAFTYCDTTDGYFQHQGFAYSKDGRNFTKHEGNPVIPKMKGVPGKPDDKEFRDPKVFWYAPSSKWIMLTGADVLRIHSSPNLREWTLESADPCLATECPDLFELPIDGDAPSVMLSKGEHPHLRWTSSRDERGSSAAPQSDGRTGPERSVNARG